MKSRILVALLSAVCGVAQVTYTAPVQPSPGVPGKVVAVAGAGTAAISCTVTGNAVPATGISVACTVAGVAIPVYTVPLGTGVTYEFGYTYGISALQNVITAIFTGPGVALSGGPLSTTVAFQVVVNGGTVSAGTL